MMNVNLSATVAKKARLGQHIGGLGERLMQGLSVLLGLGGGYLLSTGSQRPGFGLLALAGLNLIGALWYRYDLSKPQTNSDSTKLETLLTPALLGRLSAPLTPRSLWTAAANQWEAAFIINRLMLPVNEMEQLLPENEGDMSAIWQAAQQLQSRSGGAHLRAGTAIAAIATTSQPLQAPLSKLNLRPEDVVETFFWLERFIQYLERPKPYFGGVGRDWATGFTPTLDRFGLNISRSIESGQGHFHFLAHADLAESIIHDLSQGNGAVALVGEVGTGKTSLVYALAQRLLEGHDEQLKHYQLIGLNASVILASDKTDLEKLMLVLFNEAVRAGNIILFLDDAHLFFSEGTGAFNMAQVLQPVLQNRSLKIIAAFTPNDFQRLKATNDTLATSFATILVSPPDTAATMKILEDSALTLEQRSGLLISYGAVREAYRLSDQYLSEQAFPGKAINLLDQATAFAENKVLTAKSIQDAIEKTLGIKASAAQAPEAEILLNLEDRLHERMVNQQRAVEVVAAALRRGRAGVTNPDRPIGSFLFLGPTGVGKTELARSLAAVYFGDERQMIRLDMSEFQQPSDVSRILADAKEGDQSLVLAIRKQPFSVVLLDEVEKAHPNILNLLLQLLDEGRLTDNSGRPASFRTAIIIATSNAGSVDIVQRIAAGSSLENFEKPLINKLLATGQFKPELINRFDDVVLFRPLNQLELAQVAKLMLAGVNETLAKQNISVGLTEAALTQIVKAGYDPQFGARPMRHVIQKTVEDAVAIKILRGDVKAGDSFTLDVGDLTIDRSGQKFEPKIP